MTGARCCSAAALPLPNPSCRPPTPPVAPPPPIDSTPSRCATPLCLQPLLCTSHAFPASTRRPCAVPVPHCYVHIAVHPTASLATRLAVQGSGQRLPCLFPQNFHLHTYRDWYIYRDSHADCAPACELTHSRRQLGCHHAPALRSAAGVAASRCHHTLTPAHPAVHIRLCISFYSSSPQCRVPGGHQPGGARQRPVAALQVVAGGGADGAAGAAGRNQHHMLLSGGADAAAAGKEHNQETSMQHRGVDAACRVNVLLPLRAQRQVLPRDGR